MFNHVCDGDDFNFEAVNVYVHRRNAFFSEVYHKLQPYSPTDCLYIVYKWNH